MRSLSISQATLGSFLLCLSLIGRAQVDFGDAPDLPYNTLGVNNGAQHIIGTLFMGTRVDADLDGQPAFVADGDDANGVYDDEDGVSFLNYPVPGQQLSIQVQASAAGFLDAWIDWQGNGNWSDPGDQVLLNQPLQAGLNQLQINVPLNASTAVISYARFRLSPFGGLSTTGQTLDGEVEDYALYLGMPNLLEAMVDPDPGLSFVQNEISLSHRPGTNHLLCAYNDQPFPGGPGIGVSRSTNGGQSWTASQLALPLNPLAGNVPMVDVFDPAVAQDDSGRVFVVHIASDYQLATGRASGLYLHRSLDGGQSWQAPLTIALDSGAQATVDSNYRFNDRCQVIVDNNPTSPHYQNIYICWIKDRGFNQVQPYSDIYCSYSTDHGQSFSAAQQINTSSNALGNIPIPTVAANGDLYVLWIDYNVLSGGAGRLLWSRSANGGQSWQGDSLIDTIPLPPLQLNGNGLRRRGAAVLRSDPSDTNRLYLLYSADLDSTDADEADIMFRYSSDAGQSWSAAQQVNDDNSSSDQVLPWLEVSPGGVIALAWYDRRNDPNDQLWELFGCFSLDGGQSFLPNQKWSSHAFATPMSQRGGPWLGEYLGLSVSDSAAYFVFCSSAVDPQGDLFSGSLILPQPSPSGCKLAVVSDSSWQESSVVLNSNLQGKWMGVQGPLPAGNSYQQAAKEGQPYAYNSIVALDSAQVIKSGNNIRFFRKHFQLSKTEDLNLRLQLTCDDAAEIYLNGQRLLRQNRALRSNQKLPAHDVLYQNGLLLSNGYQGGEAYDLAAAVDLDSILLKGQNEIVVALRNFNKPSDKGGFSLRMDMDSCTQAPLCQTLVVSDSLWQLSTQSKAAQLSGFFAGVSGQLPPDSSFVLAGELGQPYDYPHINALSGTSVIKAAHNIRYYRRHFMLDSIQQTKLRLQMTLDDCAELYLNGHRLALVARTLNSNAKFPAFDALFTNGQLDSNAYQGGKAYSYLTAADLDTILQQGSNELIVVLRNQAKASDRGGFSLRMAIAGCGRPLPKQGEISTLAADKTLLASLYPNPYRQSFSLSTLAPEPGQLFMKLYDLRGNLLWHKMAELPEKGNHHFEGLHADLPSGYYRLHLRLISSKGEYRANLPLMKH